MWVERNCHPLFFFQATLSFSLSLPPSLPTSLSLSLSIAIPRIQRSWSFQAIRIYSNTKYIDMIYIVQDENICSKCSNRGSILLRHSCIGPLLRRSGPNPASVPDAKLRQLSSCASYESNLSNHEGSLPQTKVCKKQERKSNIIYHNVPKKFLLSPCFVCSQGPHVRGSHLVASTNKVWNLKKHTTNLCTSSRTALAPVLHCILLYHAISDDIRLYPATVSSNLRLFNLLIQGAVLDKAAVLAFAGGKAGELMEQQQ